MPLVLSLFPGGGVLDYAFEPEGFAVVRGPDPLWGGDIRRFHPPPGRFDGIIGGDPCQSHSALANLVRAKGLEPRFPDPTPDYKRVVEEAQPQWFLRENVPQAPDIEPEHYSVRSFMLDNSTLDSGDGWGNEQMRKRKFWFGWRYSAAPPELRKFMRFALHELPTVAQTVSGDSRAVPVALGGSGKLKVTAVRLRADSGRGDVLERRREKAAPLPGRHEGAVGAPGVDYSPPKRTLEEMMRLQGVPGEWFEHSPFTMQAKRKIVGNAVAVPTGRELARAIRLALYPEQDGGE